MSESRWSIWIDMEGFSVIYRADETRALVALGHLMEAIYKIGSTVYSKAPERLFTHQFGDGFVIVSDFQEDSAERPIAIAISLMRHLISIRIACKAAVACGGFSDISGCYPSCVREQSTDRRLVSIGEGLMTIMPVMGTALIASHNLSGSRPGAVLLLDENCFQTVPKGIIIHTTAPPTAVDWVHSDMELSGRISAEAGLQCLDSKAAEGFLRQYIAENKVFITEKWVVSTFESNDLYHSSRAPWDVSQVAHP